VDAVLERGPVADQVQPPSGPFPFGPYPWGGQPDLGDQVAAGQLGGAPRRRSGRSYRPMGPGL
jgi:hypothetical protein